MNERSSWGRPGPKVKTVGVAGTASVLIVFIASAMGVDIPPEAAAAIATVLSFVGGYLKSD